jgi:starch-binding outer membrane protein, SusD/RagB family
VQGFYTVAPSAKIISAYETADVRRALIGTVAPADAGTGRLYNTNMANRPFVRKHVREGGTGNVGGTDTNFIMLRLADAILLKAEALDRITPGSADAITELNKIRTRAGATLYPAAADASLTLKQVIQQERLKELAFENHRWFDLKRTGLATTVLAIAECRTFMPLPIEQLFFNENLNPQNDCYH